jgi:hypothetical protein
VPAFFLAEGNINFVIAIAEAVTFIWDVPTGLIGTFGGDV